MMNKETTSTLAPPAPGETSLLTERDLHLFNEGTHYRIYDKLGAHLTMLLQVFTLFELLGDILRNRISPLVVGEYLLNVAPFFLYNVLHLSILLAVLITLGLMQRSNEITAIKATGISIYRVIVPILVVSTMLAAGLFFFDQFYLPHANKRQDALRNLIKGKPAQTYLNPDRKWIFGQHSTIYYYQFFDSDRDQFGNLSVFKFDPATFRLTDRVYADQAHWEERLQRWVCTQGWERSVHDSAIVDYRTFDVATFATISEPPAYFKKEVRQSSEMNSEDLRRYIRDLQQSGFDVVRLRVQLQEKFAFPLNSLIMDRRFQAFRHSVEVAHQLRHLVAAPGRQTARPGAEIARRQTLRGSAQAHYRRSQISRQQITDQPR